MKLDSLISDALPSLKEAVALDPVAASLIGDDGRRIVIIGASGWIGRVLLAGLFDTLGEHEARRRIVCFGSSKKKVGFGAGRVIDQNALTEIKHLADMPTMLFHLAFLTKDKVHTMDEDSYLAANQTISRTVLGSLDCIGADRVFVASSGASAFVEDDNAAYDLRLYGRLKRDDERMFGKWSKAAPNRRAVVTRVYSVSGPFINKHDTYAIASFINDAIRGNTIRVHATKPVIRSYLAIRELLSLVFAQLLAKEGEVHAQFDSGGECLELGEVAAIVAERFGSEVIRAEITDSTANRYVGDVNDYASRLEQFGIRSVPLMRQIGDTAVTLVGDSNFALVSL